MSGKLPGSCNASVSSHWNTTKPIAALTAPSTVRVPSVTTSTTQAAPSSTG